MTACKLNFSTADICCDEQDHLIWSIFERLHKRFNSDTTHTTKCSSSVSPHSTPDLPVIPRQRRKVEMEGEAGRLQHHPQVPTLSVLSINQQIGEVETHCCSTNRHQPILRSLVSRGFCRQKAPDIVKFL